MYQPPYSVLFFSKTYPSFLTLKEGSTSLSKPLPSQKGKDVPTALSIVFTTPSVPLIGDRNGAQTASLYGWRTIRGLRQQRSCSFFVRDKPQGHGDCCLWERRDTMQEDYGTTLLIHLQYYTKTDSPHYNTSSDTYQFFGKSYFGSSKPIALHLSKLE